MWLFYRDYVFIEPPEMTYIRIEDFVHIAPALQYMCFLFFLKGTLGLRNPVSLQAHTGWWMLQVKQQD